MISAMSETTMKYICDHAVPPPERLKTIIRHPIAAKES